VTAKGVSEAKAPPEGETAPKALDHIRVGPEFEVKRKGRCANGNHVLEVGTMAHVVENTRAETKKVICAKCLSENEPLRARMDTGDLNTFLEA